MDYLEVCYFSNIWRIFFTYLLLIFNSLVVREHALYDLNHLTLLIFVT